jgi:hypothetical protein
MRMKGFPHDLITGTDPATGHPTFGFVHNDQFVSDPLELRDAPAKFGLNEEQAERLAKLNEGMRKATDAALNAGVFEIQEALGIDTGDRAGLYFSGPDGASKTWPIANMLAYYAAYEIGMAAADQDHEQPRQRG